MVSSVAVAQSAPTVSAARALASTAVPLALKPLAARHVQVVQPTETSVTCPARQPATASAIVMACALEQVPACATQDLAVPYASINVLFELGTHATDMGSASQQDAIASEALLGQNAPSAVLELPQVRSAVGPLEGSATRRPGCATALATPSEPHVLPPVSASAVEPSAAVMEPAKTMVLVFVPHPSKRDSSRVVHASGAPTDTSGRSARTPASSRDSLVSPSPLAVSVDQTTV